MPQIDKNVPMPEARRANRSCWSDFEVGDSAFFEGQVARGGKPKNGLSRSAYISAIKYGHRNNKRFSGLWHRHVFINLWHNSFLHG